MFETRNFSISNEHPIYLEGRVGANIADIFEDVKEFIRKKREIKAVHNENGTFVGIAPAEVNIVFESMNQIKVNLCATYDTPDEYYDKALAAFREAASNKVKEIGPNF